MKVGAKNISDFPKILYKFRDWSNEYNRRLLVENELFFANNYSFNDPFDLQLPIILSGNFSFNKDSFIKELNKSGLKPTEDLIDKAKDLYSKGDPEIIENLRKQFEIDSKKIEDRLGVFCASGRNDSSLMWGHYANSHKGFCVGLDTTKLKAFIKKKYPKGHVGLHKVEYNSKIPICNLSSINIGNEVDQYVRKRFSTKFKDWSYEDEIRIIVYHLANKAIKIPKEIFKEIIFGSNMSELHKKEIKIVCDALFKDLKYFEAKKNKNKFEMDITQIK